MRGSAQRTLLDAELGGPRLSEDVAASGATWPSAGYKSQRQDAGLTRQTFPPVRRSGLQRQRHASLQQSGGPPPWREPLCTVHGCSRRVGVCVRSFEVGTCRVGVPEMYALYARTSVCNEMGTEAHTAHNATDTAVAAAAAERSIYLLVDSKQIFLERFLFLRGVLLVLSCFACRSTPGWVK